MEYLFSVVAITSLKGYKGFGGTWKGWCVSAVESYSYKCHVPWAPGKGTQRVCY